MQIDKGRIMNDFIEPNKTQYTIPVYQRNYEWESEQCIKLFEDVVIAHKKQKTHFCGSIVYARLDSEQKIDNYIVIDGQQRLTTIYILIKALLDCAQEECEKDSLSKVLFNIDKFDEFSLDDSTKLKLKAVKSDSNQLLLLMDNEYDLVDKTSDIWNNYELFKGLINDELANGMTVQRIYDGLENLVVAKIRLEKDDRAQEIFERINSTGLPLSLSDKIRNFILMTDTDQERLYEKYWLVIEEVVKKEQMNTYFINYLNFKLEGFAKEDEAYDQFKKMYYSKKYTNEKMLIELLHYAKLFSTFIYGNETYSDNVNEYLDSLRKLKQTTVFVFLFSVFDDYSQGIIDEKELVKVLCFLQNYSIRRLICEIGSNSLRGVYKTLYSRVFNIKENKNNYYDSIVSFFKQLTSKDALPGDDVYSHALKYNNLYRKNALCKFLLSSIENKGKEKIITTNLTIEHIMPQNKNLSSAWQNMLGDDWKEIHESYVHTLGNLTLTGYNSELGDKPFLDKKRMLEDAESKTVRLFSKVKDVNTWDKDNIESRADYMISEILDLFPIEEPSNIILFRDPRYKEYSCVPDDAVGKTPNYYVLLGERVNVTSFAEMFKSVIIKLYALDDSIIKEMARKNMSLASWSNRAIFSNDESKVKGEYKIPNTNIYQMSEISPYYIITSIRTLIEKYDLSLDDFVYSAKAKK